MNKKMMLALFVAISVTFSVCGCGPVLDAVNETLDEAASEENPDDADDAEDNDVDTEDVVDDAEDVEYDEYYDEEDEDDLLFEDPEEDYGPLNTGDKAPNFKARLASGDEFVLSDHKDKIVLLNFWATWCPPCVNEMPAFERLKADGDKDLEIVCINCMENESDVDEFIDEMGYTFNIGYDTDGTIESRYPTSGIPYTLVIDHGTIAKIFLGARDADTQYKEYKKAIDECRR